MSVGDRDWETWEAHQEECAWCGDQGVMVLIAMSEVEKHLPTALCQQCSERYREQQAIEIESNLKKRTF